MAICREFNELASDAKRRLRYEKLTQTASIQDFYSKILENIVYLDPKPTEFDMLCHFKNELKINVQVKMETDYEHLDTWVEYTRKADSVDRGFQLEQELRKRAGGSDEVRHHQAPRNHKSRGNPRHKPFIEEKREYRPRTSSGEYNSIETIPNATKDPAKFKAWCQSHSGCFQCGSPDHQIRFHKEKRSYGRRSGN
jgi:hypothetical protein